MAPELTILLYWAALFVLNIAAVAVVLYWVIRKAVKRAILDAKRELAADPGSPRVAPPTE